MNGYQAYKYYLNCKLHFTQEKYNVISGSRVRYTLDNYLKRNDTIFFERIAKKYPQPRNLIEYFISNMCLYAIDFIYNDSTSSHENYKNWIKYKESFSYSFSKDLSMIELHFNKTLGETIWVLFNTRQIHIITVHILNSVSNFLSEFDNSILVQDKIRCIRKLDGFIKIPDNIKEQALAFMSNEKCKEI